MMYVGYACDPKKTQAVQSMGSPVQCLRCGEVYDLQLVIVTARYADCSCYTTPCCGRAVDDRMWVGLPAFRRLS